MSTKKSATIPFFSFISPVTGSNPGSNICLCLNLPLLAKSTNSDIPAQQIVRVDVQVTWKGSLLINCKDAIAIHMPPK